MDRVHDYAPTIFLLLYLSLDWSSIDQQLLELRVYPPSIFVDIFHQFSKWHEDIFCGCRADVCHFLCSIFIPQLDKLKRMCGRKYKWTSQR